jgi:hypothetical protein
MSSNPYADFTPPGGSGLYLKIEDGGQVKIRLLDEPWVFTNNFGQIRYAWPVWNYAEEKAQVFQQGVTGFKTIQGLALDEEYGDPTQYDLKVRRQGTGMDTQYQITPSPTKSPLTAEQQEAIASVDMAKATKNGVKLSSIKSGTPMPTPEPPENETPPPSDADAPGQDDINIEDIPF